MLLRRHLSITGVAELVLTYQQSGKGHRMSHHSVSGSRDASPRVSVAEDSVVSAGSASGSTSTSESSDTSEPLGHFNAGLTTAAMAPSERAPEREHDRSQATSSNGATRSDDRIPRSDTPRRPLCPTPVRRIIQATSVLVGTGGLAMATFGGVRINGEPVPELDPNRSQNIGLMVVGMVLLIAALTAFMATQTTQPSARSTEGIRAG